MQDLFIALERAFYLLDLEPEITDPEDPVPFPAPVENVAWRGVRFGYDEDKDVLAGVDLEARVGTVTAIVGGTGAGKSTLMSLLLRLYDPVDGTVSVNGVDLRDMAVSDLRSNVGIALQKNVLFALERGREHRLRHAARRPRGHRSCRQPWPRPTSSSAPWRTATNTELGERGGKLSSGQRPAVVHRAGAWCATRRC